MEIQFPENRQADQDGLRAVLALLNVAQDAWERASEQPAYQLSAPLQWREWIEKQFSLLFQHSQVTFGLPGNPDAPVLWLFADRNFDDRIYALTQAAKFFDSLFAMVREQRVGSLTLASKGALTWVNDCLPLIGWDNQPWLQINAAQLSITVS